MSNYSNANKTVPSVCFVAHNAFGALKAQDRGHIGGIERQQSTMAIWMADRGYDVSMITWNEGEGDCLIKGVKVYTFGRREDGLPGIRFFHPRWTGLNKAMHRADADIYYYNCGDLGLGQVTLWTSRHRKKALYSVANTPDCDPLMPSLKSFRERILYKYGLHHANKVVTQTVRQQEMLQNGHNISAEVIPMPCAGFGETNPKERYNDPPHILWVGRFCQEKRLEWFLDIADSLPQYIFDVVGAANIPTDYSKFQLQRAESMPNVSLHGRVVHHEMDTFYKRAYLLCCTSIYEGFPNTFLEGWSTGLPIVSTFDPDNVIVKHGLGKIAKTKEEIRSGITALIEDSTLWSESSKAAQEYFSTYHTLEAIMPRFIEVFRKLIQ